MNQLFASIKPKYAKMILNGTKSIELRRRRIKIPEDAFLWVYSTLPIGTVVAIAKINAVFHGSPKIVWRRFSSSIGITKSEYDRYLINSQWVTAIQFKKILPLKKAVSLREIRSCKSSFNPPQGIISIKQNDPLLNLLKMSLSENQLNLFD